jgi:predicted dienelactone hydrolase
MTGNGGRRAKNLTEKRKLDMSRRRTLITAIAAVWATTALAGARPGDYGVGESTRIVRPAVEREWRGASMHALLARVWYPVDPLLPEQSRDIGPPSQPTFQAHRFADDAPLASAPARYPLVIISHGTGGSVDDLDWLASGLAARGYIVAGVNHPGNNALEPLTREGLVLWWERATDLSELLDAMLTDATLGPRIDAGRIGAAGFSLGGYTVLELAGARTDLRSFEAFCHSSAADVNCHPPVSKTTAPAAAPLSAAALASMQRSGESYRDKRIKAVLAIAPAIGEALDGASLARIDIPIELIAGTADVTAPPPTNIERIAGLLPHPRVDMIPGATHDTFLDSCLPAVTAALARLCEDPRPVNRDAVHARAIDGAVEFFDSALRENPSSH